MYLCNIQKLKDFHFKSKTGINKQKNLNEQLSLLVKNTGKAYKNLYKEKFKITIKKVAFEMTKPIKIIWKLI